LNLELRTTVYLKHLERSEAVERLEQLERASVFAGPNHVEVDVNQAAMQVFVGFDCGCMITVLPKRSLTSFALIVFLRGCGRQLTACSER
jgi:hypothetical protein